MCYRTLITYTLIIDQFISNGHAASDRELLESVGISHIVNASDDDNGFPNDEMLLQNSIFRNVVGVLRSKRVLWWGFLFLKQALHYHRIDIVDMPQVNIASHFSSANKFIHEARSSGGKVLIHWCAWKNV